MSTAETMPPPTKGNTTFEKLGFRPWTVDILEHTLEDHAHEEYLDNTPPLRPILSDTVHLSAEIKDHISPILIGGFLDTAQLCSSPKIDYLSHKTRINETGMRMQSQEEVTILKERLQKLEGILKSERELRKLLEEKLLSYNT